MNWIIEKDGEYGLYSHKESDSCVGRAMTLIVAMKAEGAIIMAADGRGLLDQSHYDDNQTKLFTYKNLVIGIHGFGNLGLYLLNCHSAELMKRADYIEDFAFYVWEGVSKTYNMAPEKNRLPIGFILSGYKKSNGAQDQTIYSFGSPTNFFPELADKNPVFGGHAEYGHFFGSALYRPGIAKERAKTLAVYMIRETAKHNLNVGGAITAFEILPDGPPKRISSEELGAVDKDIISINDDFYRRFNKPMIPPTPQT